MITISAGLPILFYLLASHFICDYPLQSEFIAIGKNSNKPSHNGVPWYWIMLAHSITHGAGVALVTGNAWLGIAETIVHFNIDDAKCDGLISVDQDQWLHIACKFIWFFIWLGVS